MKSKAIMKYFDSRYKLYDGDKLIYGCKTEKGMINHIKKIRPRLLLSEGKGVIIADIEKSRDNAIRERMYKVYGLGTLYVEREWMFAKGICVRRNDDGTVDLLRKVTDHKNDGDYTEYNVVDYILLGSFKDVDKAVDYWQKECGFVKFRDGSISCSAEMDFWKYTDENEHQYSMEDIHDGYIHFHN